MLARVPLAAILTAFLLCAAALGGKWNFVWNTEGGERRSTLTLTVAEDAVKVAFPGAKAPLQGRIEGDKLTISGKLFSAEAGEEGDFRLTGKVSGESIGGEASWNEHRMTFKANRAK